MKTHDAIEDTRLCELHSAAYDLKYIKELKANHGFTPPMGYKVSDGLFSEVTSLTSMLDSGLNNIQEGLRYKAIDLMVDLGCSLKQAEELLPVLEDSFYRFMFKMQEIGRY